jgi:hypothetical protein
VNDDVVESIVCLVHDVVLDSATSADWAIWIWPGIRSIQRLKIDRQSQS